VNTIPDPLATLDAVVRAIAARCLDRPDDDPVRRSLSEIRGAPTVSLTAAIDCGAVLLDAGLIDEAEMLFEILARGYPHQAPGDEGLAQVAMQRRSWTEALTRWDALLARFVGHLEEPSWRSSRAMCLLQLGRGVEAEGALRDVVHANPELLHAFGAFLRMLVATGRPGEALGELEASAFRGDDTAMLVETRLNILIRLNRLAAARTEFERILAASEDPAILGHLFDVTPALYQGWRRTAAWLALREKLERPIAADTAADARPSESLRLRLHLALRDRGRFLSAMRRLEDERRLGPRDRRLRAVAGALDDPRYPDWAKPKIFGIGLTKTGTTTLASALSLLGFNTLDWRNPLTMELMSEEDLYLFDAFTDTPVCMRFEEYFYMFPNAKFIYTTRPVQSWQESISQHWRRHRGLGEFDELKTAMAQPDRFHYGVALRDIEQSLYFNYGGFPEAYHAHDLRVRRFFRDKARDRFLGFDVFAGDGWPELCAFLGAPTPDQAFPWTNRNPSAHDRTAEVSHARSAVARVLGGLGTLGRRVTRWRGARSP
jgi:tetratricopeptide (TPR) repeat protein